MSLNKYSPDISLDLVREMAFFQELSSMRHLGGYKSQYDRHTYDLHIYTTFGIPQSRCL